MGQHAALGRDLELFAGCDLRARFSGHFSGAPP
jgi:hypothetical protein